ncbi:hypothetical protein [Corynebacterium atypicum]|uniref:hypothetical protein n=1 Tax=Corynebacterium atypicum TaxID=191610 RepID=UPI00068BE917|nr:hypothetical protein [Corynebacterium atypicum]
MGIKEWWQARRPAPLVDAPEDPVELACSHLAVHTAEQTVVVTLPVAAVDQLRAALTDAPDSPGASRGGQAFRPVSFSAPGARSVSFVPGVDKRQSPTLDPDVGWLIPLTYAARLSLVATVQPTPGAWEIPGINLAVVAED